MPTVMEAIINALINFRREMLDNLQISLEFHTEQLEEIKYHLEHVIEEQEKRITNRVQEEFGTQFNKIANTLDQLNMRLVPTSCDEMVPSSSGSFYIRPYGGSERPFMVFCDFENHFNLSRGWTVFQRRVDGSMDFYQNWTMYKHGFGDVNGEHWLGLETLHLMTKSGRHELLVLLEDFEGNSSYAFYDEFEIASEEEKYMITVGKYSGNTYDSLTYHNGMKFSTLDQDNDLSVSNSGCANSFQGAWWFKSCYYSHLNGPYYRKGNHLDKSGVEWYNFPRANYSLKSTTMMFRSRT
ncbi:ficolin-2-like [Anopheles ziemanni]|uniref:ficolin-2-like n=1 Tax=Anopheles coustani TaxID=139045 RepID=UPI002659E085|nr:ficolin-2-like [Anopheles coustani]XP_058178505.1 ficolin-2-like [Anopheles ziemanni]